MGPIDAVKILVQWEKIKKNWNEGCMLTLEQLFKSKTFWTLVAQGFFNLIQSATPLIQNDPNLVTIVNSILTVLAIVFRLRNSAGTK